MHIFLLNGPASSGKDTAGNFLNMVYGGMVCKMARPIKDAVCAIYLNGDRDEFDLHDSPEQKNIKKAVFFGKSCREVQIAVSEMFLKPFHNDTKIFGKILAEDIEKEVEDNIQTFFVTDSGFRPEAEALITKFGASNVTLIKINRPNYTFAGDSRSYIDLSDLGVPTFEVTNDGEVADFLSMVSHIVALTLDTKAY